VSVNRSLDIGIRSGTSGRRVDLPHVLGVDPSGVIESLGPSDLPQPFTVGDRVTVGGVMRCGVCASCRDRDGRSCAAAKHLGVDCWGGYADYVVVPVANLYRIPDDLSFADATVIGRHAPSAMSLLEDVAKVTPGEWVLVMGATGGLGSFGIQVAKNLGAKVIAGAGADERCEVALQIGADFAVNYRRQDLAAAVRDITDDHGVDVVFENVGDPTLWPGAFDSLARYGRLVTGGSHGGGIVPLDVSRLYLQRITIIGATGGDGDRDAALAQGAKGTLTANIDRFMTLSEASEAHRLVESGVVHGKIVLSPDGT
jgi:NADPH:quinone reductase-like Zn-dependent oxidoreductase